MKLEWLTNIPVEDLQKKSIELAKPYKKIELNGEPICYNIKTDCLDGEIFSRCTDKGLDISNLGRIKYDNKILKQYIPEDEENLYVDIPTPERIRTEKVKKLVACEWCNNPNREIYDHIHHISNNYFDNRHENLLWVTENQYSIIHKMKKQNINNIIVELGPYLNSLIIPIKRQSIFMNEIDNFKSENNYKGIKVTCVTWKDEKYLTKEGEYKIYLFDELKIKKCIPEKYFKIMKSGYAVNLIEADAKENNILKTAARYKEKIKNGKFEELKQFYDEKNDVLKITQEFFNEFNLFEKEATSIIISDIKSVFDEMIRENSNIVSCIQGEN